MEFLPVHILAKEYSMSVEKFENKDNAVIKDDNNEISVISEYEVVEGERAKVEA